MSKAKYEYDHYRAGISNMEANKIPEVLGYAEGKDEWEKPLSANANYININSYEQFEDPDCVFLVGRIGSGKTAMLSKLKYSVECGACKKYDCVAMIDTRDYIAQLGRSIRLSEYGKLPYSEIEYTARLEWEKVINSIAMKVLYDKYGALFPDEFRNIKAFLSENGEEPSRFSISDLLKTISENLGKTDNIIMHGISTTAILLGNIVSPNYLKARQELGEIIRGHGRPLILIDSIEKYEFNDTVILAVLNALTTICLDNCRNDNGIILKMAAPSELIPNLTSVNFEKLSSKIVYIRWSFHDLKAFIAVRVYRYKKQIAGEEQVNQKEALAFFDEYYKPSCMTRHGIYFPTLAYCMSYTQKEPRQILSIFNSWIYFEEKYAAQSRMDLIDKAITYDDYSRVKGALSIYSSVHPRMLEMFERTFTNKKYCFSESEFDQWLRSCSKIRGQIEAYELKKYFISSGLVGTMVEMHHIPEENKDLKNKRYIRIKEVLFEYQRKDFLPFNDETRFCLHPMVFGALNIVVDRNTLVYPRPAEDEYVPWEINTTSSIE